MPELQTKSGVACVAGIAIGRAVVWRDEPPRRTVAASVKEERARLERGIATAKRGVAELMRLLPRAEADLFEPELLILDELGATLGDRLQEGMHAEDVVDDSTSEALADLLHDARARILDAMAHHHRSVEEHVEGRAGDLVLVIANLTPSIVASLPARVVGVVAASDVVEGPGAGPTSHAAILARGRDLTLALLATADVAAIADGVGVIVDTLGDTASVSIDPDAAAEEAARTHRSAWTHARAEEEAQVSAPLAHLDLRVLVNVGSLHERVPASAEGIGLVRTELVFSDHARVPSEAEQFGALCAIGAHAPRARVVVRLFDVGGDKSVPWLPAPPGRQSARGIELLLLHPRVLELQLRALARAAAHVDLGVLVPYVRSASEVVDVRARLRGRIPVGALIETTEAVEHIEDVASASDFVSIGTNDLAAIVTRSDRSRAGLALDPRVLRMIERVVVAARARSREVTVCGEMAGDPHGARVLVGLGVRSISMAPARIAPVKLSLRQASLDECRSIARAAMKAA